MYDFFLQSVFVVAVVAHALLQRRARPPRLRQRCASGVVQRSWNPWYWRRHGWLCIPQVAQDCACFLSRRRRVTVVANARDDAAQSIRGSRYGCSACGCGGGVAHCGTAYACCQSSKDSRSSHGERTRDARCTASSRRGACGAVREGKLLVCKLLRDGGIVRGQSTRLRRGKA